VHPSSGTLLGRHPLCAPIDARSSLLASPSPSAAGSGAIRVRRSAIEHSRQEAMEEPRMESRTCASSISRVVFEASQYTDRYVYFPGEFRTTTLRGGGPHP